MQRTRGDSVGIRQIPARYSAQAHEIEIGIFGYERIERPFDEADSARQGLFSLKQFQEPPDAAVPVRFQDGCHVRMQEGLASTPPGDGQCKSHQISAMKGAENLAAGF
jgi:hypothetical protein